MIARATEADGHDSPPQPNVVQGRFARDASEFATIKETGQ
jgi:hypothetical protein